MANGASNEEDATRVLDRNPLEVAWAGAGMGGGGISILSLSTVGILASLAGDGAEARCALLREGKAGGMSSSVAVSDPSSSSSSTTKDPGMVRLFF